MNRGATIVFAPTRLLQGSYPGSAERRIAPPCSDLHHRDLQTDVCVIRLFAAARAAAQCSPEDFRIAVIQAGAVSY